MGVFEFVTVAVVLSFVLKVVKLHYESSDKQHAAKLKAKMAAKNGAELQRANPEANRNWHAPVENFPRHYPVQPSAAHSGSPWWGLFAAVCALLPMAFFFLPGIIRNFSEPRFSDAPIVTAERAPEAPHVEPAVATPKVEDPDSFIADYYPSVVDCGAPMAIKIYNEISDKLPAEAFAEAEEVAADDRADGKKNDKAEDDELTGHTEFYVTNAGLSEQEYVPFLVAFRKKMQSKIEGCTVRDVSGQVTDYLPKPQSLFRVYVSTILNVVNGEEVNSAGRVVCKLKGRDVSTEVLTYFVDKLWLSDFEAFAAKNPGKQFVVGRSGGFLPDDSQAREQAFRNVNAFQNRDTRNASEYLIGNLFYKCTDTFRQKYQRSYGDVYRYSVLLELDLDRADLVRSNTNGGNDFRTDILPADFNGFTPSFEWSIALLIGLTVVIGTISNVLTQGYYRMEISNVMLAFVLAGFCLLILIVVSTVG